MQEPEQEVEAKALAAQKPLWQSAPEAHAEPAEALPIAHVGASFSRRFKLAASPDRKRDAADTTVVAHNNARAATAKWVVSVVFMVEECVRAGVVVFVGCGCFS